jgi:hypothetical protein
MRYDLRIWNQESRIRRQEDKEKGKSKKDKVYLKIGLGFN